jgi:menaquinone-dependent protoporphyrinogen IX oxidase
MEALIIVDSRYGNTEQIALTIGEALSGRYRVRVVPVAEAGALSPTGLDLLLVGAPTELHRASAAMRTFLAQLQRNSLRDVPAAAFDTRIPGMRLFTGSAAVAIARKLQRAGCRLVADPESFLVHRPAGAKQDGVVLEAGERERAARWATTLIERVSVTQPA